MRVRAIKDQAGIKVGEIGIAEYGFVRFANCHIAIPDCKKYPEWFQIINDHELILSELVEGKHYRNLRTGYEGKYGVHKNGPTLYTELSDGIINLFDLFVEVAEEKTNKEYYDAVNAHIDNIKMTHNANLSEEKPQMMICHKHQSCQQLACSMRTLHEIDNENTIRCCNYNPIPYVEEKPAPKEPSELERLFDKHMEFGEMPVPDEFRKEWRHYWHVTEAILEHLIAKERA